RPMCTSGGSKTGLSPCHSARPEARVVTPRRSPRRGKLRAGATTEMDERRGKDTPACRQCGCAETAGHGSTRGKRRWRCHGCGRSFGVTTGTPLAGLKTDVGEIARALLVVMRRGSLRAAEEITGHKYETIGEWLRRAAAHAAALTE